MRNLVQIAGSVLLVLGCGSGTDAVCAVPPCAFPVAMLINVSAQGTTATIDATVDVTGAAQTSVQCPGTCIVPGMAGNYHVKISAAGYRPFETDVKVSGSDGGKCSCPSVNRETVAATLVSA